MKIKKVFPDGCADAVIPDKQRYKKRYKMTVTEYELEILRALLWSVCGKPHESPRKEVDAMSNAMDVACDKVSIEPRFRYSRERILEERK